MDIDGEGPEANYNRMMDEREERGKMVEERRGKEVMELRTAMGVVWIMYMRFARRAEVSYSLQKLSLRDSRADAIGS
jgi:cleavage stimulation factor subunit 3